MAVQSGSNVRYAARVPYEEPLNRPVRPTSIAVAAIFFLFGAVLAILVHESIYISLIEHFGGIVTSVNILGFVISVTNVFTVQGWTWTGDIAHAEGYFPKGVSPSPSDLWLCHWMPEVVGLISAILILIILVKWKIDDPKLFGFLLGVLSISVLGLTAVAVSFLI